MKKCIFCLSILLILTGLMHVKEVTAQPFDPTWKSLKQYEVPEWWLDAKFGIYFHWGPYSVPAYWTEWYSHWMYQEGNDVRKHHEEKYGNLREFGYKDFIPMFTAEKFDPDAWAELFKKAGAKFAGPVAEHADGFAMWDSKLTMWDAKDMGPKKDIVGLMEEAIRKQGMKYIVTYHRQWLYAWYPTWDTRTDAANPLYAGLYGPKIPKGTFTMALKPVDPLPDDAFNQEWLDRLNELIHNYEPDIIWFDNKVDIIHDQYRRMFLAGYYNAAHEWGREVVTTYKFDDFEDGTAVLDLERSRMSEKKEFPWLADISIDWKAWCHISNPDYKSTNRVIDFLVDAVSKNGAVLLNITPKANGEIPDEVKKRLLETGQWFDLNGEAIYGPRPWKIYGEGPQQIVEGHLSERENPEAVAEDIRFTTKNDILYAITLAWPDDNLVIKSLSPSRDLLERKVERVEMLGSSEELNWQMTDAGLEVEMPKEKPCDHAFVLKLNFDR